MGLMIWRQRAIRTNEQLESYQKIQPTPDSHQKYIQKLKSRKEISEEDYKMMYPKNVKIGRAHGSAKDHKEIYCQHNR